MTGFLSNLIARSSGRLPAIQPRLSSLFEPQRGVMRQPAVNPFPRSDEAWGNTPGVFEDHFDNSTRLRTRQDEPRAQDSPTTTEHSVSLSIPSEIAVRNEGSDWGSAHEPGQAMPAVPTGRENARGYSASTITTPPVRMAAPSLPQSAPSISQLLQRQKKPGLRLNDPYLTDLGGQTDASDNHSSPRVLPSSKPERQDGAAQDREHAGHSNGFIHPANSLAPRAPLGPEIGAWIVGAKDTQLNLRSPQRLLEIETPAPAPEPIVHVSIDRIEVRAVVPATSSARSERSPQPVMSLKEYLRQRSTERNGREAS